MNRASARGRPGRGYLIAALVVFAVFAGDIVIAKVQVLLGRTLPIHLGDTVQFLVLLVAVTLFVIGTLVREMHGKESDVTERERRSGRTQ